MTKLHVDPDELTATAGSLDRRVESLQAVRRQVHGATVPAGAFGRIPGVGPYIDSIYTRHVAESTELLQEATDGLDSASRSLRATGEGFRQLEENLAKGLRGE
jgi:uncharacterized protein YukE